MTRRTHVTFNRILLGVLCLMYLAAALWPQAMSEWLPGLGQLRSHWWFMPVCLVIWLSASWLVFCRQTRLQLRWFQGVTAIAAIMALMFVSVGLGCTFLALSSCAGVASRKLDNTALPDKPSD